MEHVNKIFFSNLIWYSNLISCSSYNQKHNKTFNLQSEQNTLNKNDRLCPTLIIKLYRTTGFK